MCEYLNGKIYKIGCEITGEVYIGSTRLSLEDRLIKHVDKNSNCCSKQIIDRNKYYIEQLESYPCNSKQELERKEGEYQRAFECININIAGRTKLEYYEDNKERIAKRNAEHYQDNKERIAKRNAEYQQNNKQHFKEYSKQYRLENTEMIKAIRNKEVICECGTKSTHGHLIRHKRSKKHIDLMSKLKQPCADPGDEGTLVCYRVGRI